MTCEMFRFKVLSLVYLLISLFVTFVSMSGQNQRSDVVTLREQFLPTMGLPFSKTSRQRRSIPAGLDRNIAYSLKNMHMAHRKKIGEGVDLDCSGSLTTQFMSYFPRATFQWIFNNEGFILAPERMLYRNNGIVIQSVTVDDSGLYLCQLEYTENSKKKRQTFAFHSLSVFDTEPTVQVQVYNSFNLECPSQYIARLYEESYKYWLLNGKKYSDLSKIPAKKGDPEVIKSVDNTHAGTWTCEVIDPISERKWELNFYFIQVLPAPWMTAINSIKANKKYMIDFMGVTTGIALVIIIIAIILSTRQENKQAELLHQIKIQLIKIKTNNIELRGQPSPPSSVSSVLSFSIDSDADPTTELI